MSSLPLLTPQPRPVRSRRTAGWVLAGLLLAMVLLLTALGGYLAGRLGSARALVDPISLRALLNRPLDMAAPGASFWVMGYYVPYDRASLDHLAMRSPHLDQVISFSYGMRPDGTVTGEDPLLLHGVISGRKLSLLFANISEGSFSQATARAVLSDSARRSQAVAGIVAKVKSEGAASAQLDFEDVPADQRQAYTVFVQELAAALHAESATLSLAIPAKTADNPKSAWSGAFDYAALAQAADLLVIMAYDEHYRLGDPGPVASLPWVEKVIRYAISVAPTGKLALGLPGYGYDWLGKAGKAYGIQAMADRLAKLQANIQFDSKLGENVALYREADKLHVAWYPDERSLAAKLALARQYNLKGVALWRLGFEPDSYWAALANVQ